jgi:peptidoglycan hydrolase-like protein with peptidoglycan-binding domain
VDGWFGTNTQAAVLRFQQAQGLTPNGRLDAATLVALTRAGRTG